MISVVIPTYNESDNIERCLSALSAQSIERSEYEIIVVDGESSDATVEIAKKYVDKVVFQKSKGIPGARNDGVRAAKGEIIATTDADAIVPCNWLERVNSHFRNKDVVGVIGPVEPIELGPKSHVMFRIGNALLRIAYLAYLGPTPGNNCAFKKEPFLDAGGFNKDLHHTDDLEMGSRLKKKGKIIYDPYLVVKVSTRRMDKDGYLWTGINWVKRWWTVLAFKKTEYIQYARKES